MSAWSLLKIAVENSEKLKDIDPSLPEVENAKAEAGPADGRLLTPNLRNVARCI
jgi:hypothetical protein